MTVAPGTKELVVRLPPELHAQLKDRADAEDRSLSATIRVAIRQYLERGE
jgi:predicted transcriptional regulator